MITWIWITGVPVLLFGIGIGALVRQLRRTGWTAAGQVAAWRLRRAALARR